MAKSSKSRFPKSVFVHWEEDPNSDEGGYLVVAGSSDDVEDGELVAVYELRAVKTKRVAHALE